MAPAPILSKAAPTVVWGLTQRTVNWSYMEPLIFDSIGTPNCYCKLADSLVVTTSCQRTRLQFESGSTKPIRLSKVTQISQLNFNRCF